MRKIEIVVNAMGRGTVKIDGHVLDCVTSVSVRCRAGKRTSVFLQLVGDVEITAEAGIATAEILAIPLTVVRGTPAPDRSKP